MTGLRLYDCFYSHRNIHTDISISLGEPSLAARKTFCFQMLQFLENLAKEIWNCHNKIILLLIYELLQTINLQLNLEIEQIYILYRRLSSQFQQLWQLNSLLLIKILPSFKKKLNGKKIHFHRRKHRKTFKFPFALLDYPFFLWQSSFSTLGSSVSHLATLNVFAWCHSHALFQAPNFLQNFWIECRKLNK